MSDIDVSPTTVFVEVVFSRAHSVRFFGGNWRSFRTLEQVAGDLKGGNRGKEGRQMKKETTATKTDHTIVVLKTQITLSLG